MDDKVKFWLESSWDLWHAEKRSWFTDKFVANIPEELVPGGTAMSEEELGNEHKGNIGQLREKKRKQSVIATALSTRRKSIDDIMGIRRKSLDLADQKK